MASLLVLAKQLIALHQLCHDSPVWGLCSKTLVTHPWEHPQLTEGSGLVTEGPKSLTQWAGGRLGRSLAPLLLAW